MNQNPYESPKGTSDTPIDQRILLARRIWLFLYLAVTLGAMYFIYDSLASQLFILAR